MGCLDIMCPLLSRNSIADKVTVHHNIVASTAKTISVPQGCDPGFNPDKHIHGDDDTKQQQGSHDDDDDDDDAAVLDIVSVSAADFVQPNQQVLMIKIDTEGTEIGVLQSLEPLLADGRARDIVVEVKLKSWKADERVQENVQEFIRLVYDNHFRVYSLEKKLYIEPASAFEPWLMTTGSQGDNNFWLQKEKDTSNQRVTHVARLPLLQPGCDYDRASRPL